MNNPMPTGWNKTLADLFEEMRQGKRLIITDQEGAWAREYEKSLLPRQTVFPREGEIWEAIDSCEVEFEVFFAAPNGGPSGTARLPRGERVRIGPHTDSDALLVHFLPLRYQELQDTIVAPRVRANPRYSDYALYAKTAYFNQHFRRVKRA